MFSVPLAASLQFDFDAVLSPRESDMAAVAPAASPSTASGALSAALGSKFEVRTGSGEVFQGDLFTFDDKTDMAVFHIQTAPLLDLPLPATCSPESPPPPILSHLCAQRPPPACEGTWALWVLLNLFPSVCCARTRAPNPLPPTPFSQGDHAGPSPHYGGTTYLTPRTPHTLSPPSSPNLCSDNP